MYCLRCGTQNNEDAKFCRNCSEKLSNSHYDQARYSYNYSQTGDSKSTYSKPMDHGQYYNYSYSYSNNGQNPINQANNHQDQYYYSYNYSNENVISGDERYIANYVGPSYKHIKNSKFSFSTLLFGPFYFLNRKLFYYSFIWFFALSIIYYYIPEYFEVFYLFINIFLATKFSTIYLEKVEQTVDKIKHQSLDLTSNEMLDKCKKDGGTLINPITIFIILFVLFLLGTIFMPIYFAESDYDTNISEDYENITENYEQLPSEQTIKDLNIKLPNGFTSTYESNYAKTYTYKSETDHCRIGIHVNNYISSYANDEEYLKNNVYIENFPEIFKTNLNGTEWASILYTPNTTTLYYNYAHIHNNTGYLVNFDIIDNNTNECSKKYSEFTSSLHFK